MASVCCPTRRSGSAFRNERIRNSTGGRIMPLGRLIEYEDASDEVRAVFDDIMATRKSDWVNNFWKALAQHPETLRRTWESVKQVMAPGALDPLTKELLYVAVSVTNGCEYCIASHTASARKKGMTEEQLAELLAVVGMANQTNALATGYGVRVDDAFRRE
jgi:AhpD family alkylhydroperoxidase